MCRSVEGRAFYISDRFFCVKKGRNKAEKGLRKKSKIFLHLYNSTLFYFSIKKPFISPKNFFKKIKINRFFNVILKFGMYSVVKKGEKPSFPFCQSSIISPSLKNGGLSFGKAAAPFWIY